jgi:hypothetical protein
MPTKYAAEWDGVEMILRHQRLQEFAAFSSERNPRAEMRRKAQFY